MIDQHHTHAEAIRFAPAPCPAWASALDVPKAWGKTDIGVAHSPVAVTSRAVSNGTDQSLGIQAGLEPTVRSGRFDFGGFKSERGEGVLRGGRRAGI